MERVRDFLNNLPKTNNLGEEITLVGATKTVDADKIKQAFDHGILHVGENKAQEFLQKFNNYPRDATLHFIGHLQTNKVKQLVGKVNLIQSVDSLKLLNEINECALKQNITQDILLEVNIANDQNKHGFLKEEIVNAVRHANLLPCVNVLGLMTVLPKCENKEKLCKLCLHMRNLYDIIKESNPSFRYLSMGMSGDYETAIQNGSNMIRIGSLLFGDRDYGKKG